MIAMKKNSQQIIRMTVLAATVAEMGDPGSSGKIIANIIRFIINRISPDKRGKSVTNLRNKIWAINEYDIANKKNPSTASLGQAITFVKTILIGHHPIYIRRVIQEIVRNLY
jgi:hypothetical protein